MLKDILQPDHVRRFEEAEFLDPARAAPDPDQTIEHQWDQAERWRRWGGEAIGTFAIVFAAGGSSVANELSSGAVGLVGAALASGLAVMAMIYALGHICNAHFNPAVTLAFCIARHFPLREVPGYMIAQLVGAVAAASVLRLTFPKVAHLGANVPGSAGAVPALVMEIVLSFFLMFVIVAVATDTRAVGQAAAIAIGVTVVFDILIGGPVSGASMNPARSFGPALLSGIWQDQWVYWIGPFVGAIPGALAYQFLRGAPASSSKQVVTRQ